MEWKCKGLHVYHEDEAVWAKEWEFVKVVESVRGVRFIHCTPKRQDSMLSE